MSVKGDPSSMVLALRYIGVNNRLTSRCRTSFSLSTAGRRQTEGQPWI